MKQAPADEEIPSGERAREHVKSGRHMRQFVEDIPKRGAGGRECWRVRRFFFFFLAFGLAGFEPGARTTDGSRTRFRMEDMAGTWQQLLGCSGHTQCVRDAWIGMGGRKQEAAGTRLACWAEYETTGRNLLCPFWFLICILSYHEYLSSRQAGSIESTSGGITP